MSWRAKTSPIPKAATKQLVQVFLFSANSMADQDHPSRPKMPEGFPPHMILYDRFAEERGWHPRDVDRLTRDELFWLPIVKEARMTAAEQLAAAKEK